MPPRRLWPLALLLACTPPTRPSTPPVATTRTTPPTRSPPTPSPLPLDSDADGVIDRDDQCPDEDEIKNDHRDGDGCPDEQAIGYGYFLNSLHPVQFAPPPLPRRGAPGHVNVFLATEESATEVYPFVPPDRFLTTARAPRSTTAANADTAAYPQLRRFLARGALPPIGALRLESMIDYFRGETIWTNRGLQVESEVGPCPWAPAHRLVQVRVHALGDGPHPRTFVLLVDTSRSMGAPERLPLLKQALPTLLAAMRPEDRLAVISFPDRPELVLPPTSIGERSELEAAIAALRPRGNTVRYTLFDPALAALRKLARPGELTHFILATDGVGWTPKPPIQLGHGDALSVLELGVGDLEDATLTNLAADHDGHLYHLDTVDEARRTFSKLAYQGPLIAGDLQLQAEFSPQQVAAYRQVGHANLQISEREFTRDLPAGERVSGGPILGRRRAGDLHAGQSITLLYELVPAAATTPHPLEIHLRYRARGRDRRDTHLVHDPGVHDLAATSHDFRFTAAVATFGLLVHGGPRGAATLELARSLAAGALHLDLDGERSGFLALLDRAKQPLAERLAQWATEDAWLRAHPPTVEIPPAAIPLLTFEAMRMQISNRLTLIGHHDGHEASSPAERDAIAIARAEAVHRWLVEVMHHPPAKYEVRLATPDDANYDDGTPIGRARNRSVEFAHILQ